ncbi:sensor histidine kinase [Fictibacillus aquaticus]|uniref:histidine kinase n=1 Tax=Fictibacillus aquaticus TaxID=2021314 RepID=A0A235F533_9BACL|nr:PAS domain-containing sensor histidine kinase [Fictibacillus aquaticus]OYD56416.1 hypothetical protein CGZ90_17535 [Fictibacillus aquaticus]
MDYIRNLCRQHTRLTDEEISLIVDKSNMLQTIADLSGSHVFIDCMTAHPEKAVVVAEAVPSTSPLLYKEQVVGTFIYETFEPAVFSSFKSRKPVMVKRAVTTEGQHVSQNVIPILFNEKAIGVMISEKDISAQIEHEKEIAFLTEATQEFGRTFWDMISKQPSIPDVLEDGLLLLNDEGKILYANNYAIRLIQKHLGQHSHQEYKDKSIYELFPFIEKDNIGHFGIVEREIAYEGRVYIKRMISLKSKDSPIVLIYLRDITDLREKERQLVVKSAVIKEIHHRVKNNLQTVASLLRLQMRRGVPEDTKHLYQESLNRIMSIATVHEFLSYSGMEMVNISEILEKIAKMLVYQSDQSEHSITLVLDVDEISLKSNQAVSLSLIFNEILQNSIKHGFKNQSGTITVKMKLIDGEVHLSVVDDGEGYKPGVKKDQLGLEIVRNLTEFDLSGEFLIYPNKERGTTAAVQFFLEQEDLYDKA